MHPLGAARAALFGLALLGGVAAAPLRSGPPPVERHCSTEPPTKFTADRPRWIVWDAEVIVRAKAIGAVPAPAASKRPDATHVAFAVLEVLKGDAPDTLAFYGGLDDRDSFQEGPVPYEMFHRWYGGGDCLAMTYRPGGEYLLLLSYSERWGVLDPYWQILAPTNEQIRGADDPWVRWVRQELLTRSGRRLRAACLTTRRGEAAFCRAMAFEGEWPREVSGESKSEFNQRATWHIRVACRWA